MVNNGVQLGPATFATSNSDSLKHENGIDTCMERRALLKYTPNLKEESSVTKQKGPDKVYDPSPIV